MPSDAYAKGFAEGVRAVAARAEGRSADLQQQWEEEGDPIVRKTLKLEANAYKTVRDNALILATWPPPVEE
jgi:hypothetical protein